MNHLIREHPLFDLVLCLLIAVLAYGTFRHLNAHAARPPKATAEMARDPESQAQVTLHIADPSADMGPGCDEAALAQSPSR